MKRSSAASAIRTLSALLAIMLAIPLSWKGISGLYVWMSPLIMLGSGFALRSFLWMNALAFMILIAVILRRRWFCRHICPVGWGCDLVSTLRRGNAYTYDKVPHLGKWMAVITLAAALAGFPLLYLSDPMALFHGFFAVFSGTMSPVAVACSMGLPLLLALHVFLPGIWCSKLCPLGGFQLVMADLVKKAGRFMSRLNRDYPDPDKSRRYFLASGIGLVAGLAIPSILRSPSDQSLRPPAASRPDLFNSLCCRCGNCSRACPTLIITPRTDTGHVLSWMTPEVTFGPGYCLENCNLCGNVCPTGAITRFSVDAKRKLFMGSAEILLKDCLLLHNRECSRCRDACSYNALELSSPDNVLQTAPVVSIGKCVGCGACEVICPAGCIRVVPGHDQAGRG